MAARRLGDPHDHLPSRAPARVSMFRCGDTQFAVVGVGRHDELVLAALSAAESEVATLAAAGLTNAAIANRRSTSPRTVANQMASIFRKLRLGSRYELAARIASPLSKRTPP